MCVVVVVGNLVKWKFSEIKKHKRIPRLPEVEKKNDWLSRTEDIT